MKPKVMAVFFSRKYAWCVALLPLLVLLTGCPHNEYTVELKPQGVGLERTLTFYRADDTDTNSITSRRELATNELAAITQLYPAGAMSVQGNKYVAHGVFTNALPADVGGNGHFTNLVTSLGSTSYYLERFRGSDDLVARTTNQFAAADQLADLVVGWAKTEFGRERNWKSLRQFLTEDFRNDLKNAGLYFWLGSAVSLTDTNAPEEFVARFTQYLLERGYVQPSDLPLLSAQNSEGVLRLVQRQVARRLNVSAAGPMPPSLAIFTNAVALEKSWTNYLAQTDLYHAKIREWKKAQKLNPEAKRPDPAEIVNPIFENFLNSFRLFETPDQLTVRLAISHAPNHSNGKWQDGHIEWKVALDASRALPVVCYANWSQPDELFQKSHFGEVLLKGDELNEYCLWFHSLSPAQADQWEQILSGIKPEQDFKNQWAEFKKQL